MSPHLKKIAPIKGAYFPKNRVILLEQNSISVE